MKSVVSRTLPILFALAANLPCSAERPAKPVCTVLESQLVLHDQPFSACHASTLVETGNGTIMAAFFGGSYEGASDVCIWGIRQTNGGWSAPFRLADGNSGDNNSFPCWNPVLFKTKTGKLYLFYKVGKNPREWFGLIKTSEDKGITWTEPVRLPAGIMGPVKDKPVELPGGKLLCPSSTETDTEWKVQMEIFKPSKGSWKLIPVDHSSGFQVIQPSLLRYSGSHYRILCRSKSNLILTAVTRNRGKTWSRITETAVPNPNSGIDAITLKNGTHLLVYNPLTVGREWSDGRNRLNLAWSPDGLNWTDLLELEKQDKGEFSYPAIIQSSDGLIHITYTHNRTQIRYVKIRLN